MAGILHKSAHKQTVYWAVIALLIGAGFLLNNLEGYQTLWVDEGWSIAAAQQPTLVDVTTFVAEDVHPPLYFQLLHSWQALAGDTIFALRYLSVLIVLLGGACVYRLGGHLGAQVTVAGSPFVGASALLLYLLHDLVQVLGREVRQYPLAHTLAALVLLLYWRYQRHPSIRRALPFVLAGVALLYTHYWGGFLLLALAVHLLLVQGRAALSRFVPFIIIGVLFAPWLPVVANQISGEAEGGLGHAVPSNYDGLKILAFQLLGRPELFWLALVVVGLIGFALRDRVISTERSIGTFPGLMPALVLVLPLMLSFIINLELATMSFRALSIVVPAVALLIGLALASFRTYERLVLTLITFILLLGMTASTPPARLPWPDTAAFIAQYSAADDVVLIETDFDTYALDYYLERQNPDLRALFTEVERRRKFDTLPAFEGDLLAQLTDLNGLWVVRFSSNYDLLPLLEANGWVQTARRIQPTTGPLNVESWRYDRPPTTTITTYGDVLALRRAQTGLSPAGLTVTLLWSPRTTPTLDYTISTFLLDAQGALVAQNDSPPLSGLSPTTTWGADGLYFDAHYIDTRPLPPGTYQVGVKVYNFTDASFQTITVQPPTNCVDAACEYVIIDTIEIGASGG